MAPRVTVVVPSYNRARLLPVALDSALAQSYRDVEVIVVDDGSDDDTAAVVAGYGDRVRYVAIERSGGPARPRNVGLGLAEGELVAFLDSDDAWLPDMLEAQVARLDVDPAAALVCSNARVVDPDGSEEGELYFEPGWEPRGETLHALLRDNFVIASSVVARREALVSAGGFTEEPLLTGIVEDYDLWLRIAAAHELRYDSEPLVLYRRHAASLSGEMALIARWRAHVRILDRLAPVVAGRPEALAFLRARRAEYVEELARATRATSRSWAHAAARQPGAVGTLLLLHVRRRHVAVWKGRP